MAGTQWAENTSPTDTRFILRNTIGGTPVRRAPAQDTVYTIGYGYGESSMILSGREDRVLGISDADPERKDAGQAYKEVSLSSDDGSLFENKVSGLHAGVVATEGTPRATLISLVFDF